MASVGLAGGIEGIRPGCAQVNGTAATRTIQTPEAVSSGILELLNIAR